MASDIFKILSTYSQIVLNLLYAEILNLLNNFKASVGCIEIKSRLRTAPKKKESGKIPNSFSNSIR